MNTCTKCGRSFTGNFCPGCGTKYEPAAQQSAPATNTCANCGRTFTGNFCPGCGTKYEPAAQQQSAPVTNTCTNCGRTFTGNFCPGCGTKYEPAAQQSAPATNTCANCGRTFTGNFCPGCGTKYGSSAQTQQQYAQAQYAQYQQTRNYADTELDWRKYNPTHAGVSYNVAKDYHFHHADGFVGSVPQSFVDRTFPKCPICCSSTPYWNIAQHNQMSWKGNLYLFRCSSCGAVISMSMPDVTTLGNGGSGIVFNPSVGLTNLIVKSHAGKDTGAVYAVIESVGNSGVSRECEGKEFRLEHLQDMFLRK